MKERRSHHRKCTSDYFLAYDLETDELIGRVLDLSTEGAMLISDDPIPLNRRVRCKLVMPRMVGTRRFITFEAESRWCEQNKHWKWYEVGYKFTSLSKEDRRIIEDLTGDWIIKGGPKPLTVTVSGN